MSDHSLGVSSRWTLDRCRQWLEQRTFRLQPESYLEAHPDWPGAVGIEIEMLPLYANEREGGKNPRSVRLQGETLSIASWLRELAEEKNWTLKEVDGLLMNVFMDHDDNLSFEPGGQLEFSSRPYECLSEAVDRTKVIQTILDSALLKKGGVTLTQVGINPWHSVDDLGLQMTKPRYIAMDEYFGRISPYGPRMMRQTCTVQVNLDFGRCETTMAKRYLASLLLAPFAGAMFNNSPITERQKTGMTGFRSKIWRHMDPSRTGVPSLDHLTKSLNKKGCVETYLNFLLNARVVFVTSLNYKVMHQAVTFRDWMSDGIDGVFPNQEDFETHLSLLFPDVRARGFLELRSVDCQARPWQFVPASWWTGLLYDATACDQVIDRLLPLSHEMESLLDSACFGMRDERIARGLKDLFAMSLDGLSRLPGCYYGHGAKEDLVRFGEKYTLRGRVPADDLLDSFAKQGQWTWQAFEDAMQA